MTEAESGVTPRNSQNMTGTHNLAKWHRILLTIALQMNKP